MGIGAVGCWCDDKPWNDVRYLPDKVKSAVLEKLSRYQNDSVKWGKKFNELKKWIALNPADRNELQNSFMDYNAKIDKIRKEKFSDIFPEYSKLFD